MMIARLFITITLSAMLALNVSGQYFSKAYFEDLRFGRNFGVQPIGEGVLLTTLGIIKEGTNYEEIIIGKLSENGNYQSTIEIEGNRLFITGEDVRFKNNFLYYACKDEEEVDNNYNWYFGKMTLNGDLVFEKKYKIPTPFQNYTNIYGFEFVKDDEVIIWGNGYDPSTDNVIDSVKFVWLRLDIEGNLISGPHYYRPAVEEWGIVNDAMVDIDGNLVYIYETHFWDQGYFRYIYKVNEDNSVTQLSRTFITAFNDYATFDIAIDSTFILSSPKSGVKGKLMRLIKVDRAGDTVWTSLQPKLFSDFYGFTNLDAVDNIRVSRIRTAINGDILVAGTNSYIDSFVIDNRTGTKKLVGSWNGSFMSRYTNDGKLLWNHFMVSLNDKYEGRTLSIFNINEMPDGSLIVCGAIGKRDTTKRGFNSWIMRVGPNGCFDADCSHVVNDKWWMFPDEIPTATTDLTTYLSLSLYPNPGQNTVHVSLPSSVHLPITYQVSTMLGEVVETGTQERTDFDVDMSPLPSAVYLILCRDQRGQVWYSRWVKGE